ncbi:type II secretion system F family protein [Candidatus Parvarchaeota archaeon]|nr:type II secretion system F family protein [Candidatus Parvarchaeota archaeon]
MDEKHNFLFNLQFLLFSKVRKSIANNIMTAQINTDRISELTGLVTLAILIMTVLVPIVLFVFTKSIIFSIVSAPLVYFGGSVLIDSVFSAISDSVATSIEKVLPDMLLLMAANLRAGMIPENSFLASIKPEFGKLNYLLSSAAIEVQGGRNFAEALMDMSGRTSSLFFKDTMRIISEGIRAGAELHLILENLADNMLQNESIRNDMKAQVRSYALFIFLASTIAAPLLYGVASFLIGILDNISKVSGASTANVPSVGVGIFSSFSLPSVPVTLILVISVINVIITTGSSAILGGILNTGKAKDGMKKAPIYALIGIAIFFVVRFGVSTFFASSQLGGGGGL